MSYALNIWDLKEGEVYLCDVDVESVAATRDMWICSDDFDLEWKFKKQKDATCIELYAYVYTAKHYQTKNATDLRYSSIVLEEDHWKRCPGLDKIVSVEL